MEFAYLEFSALFATRQSTEENECRQELVQRWVALAEVVDAAAFDAAFPSGGMKTGTTNADRIIKTAKPTRTSTTVTRHFRFGFFI
jgi:hypothetical protein